MEQRLEKKERMRTTIEALLEEKDSSQDPPGGTTAKEFLQNDVKYQILHCLWSNNLKYLCCPNLGSEIYKLLHIEVFYFVSKGVRRIFSMDLCM